MGGSSERKGKLSRRLGMMTIAVALLTTGLVAVAGYVGVVSAGATELVNEAARRALIPVSISFVVSVVASVALAQLAARRVTRPLRELERAAVKVASGGSAEPVALQRDDEIGSLARAFNDVTLRLNSMHDVAQLLVDTTELDHVLHGVMDAMEHLVPDADVALFLMTASRRLRLARSSAAHSDSAARVDLAAAPWVRRALSEGEAVSEELLSETDPFHRLYGAGTVVSGLAVSLVAGRDAVGALALTRAGGRPFSEAEAKLVRTFSAQAAVAVHNSRLFDEERTSRREAEVLRAVAEHIANPADLGHAMIRVAAETGALLGMPIHLVLMRAPDVPGRGGADEADASCSREEWFVAWRRSIERERRPRRASAALFVGQARHDDVFAACAERVGAEVLVLAPLLRAGEFAGLVVLGSPDGGVHLSERQMTLFETIAAEVSLALDNAYLITEAQSRAQNLETIFRISQAVSSSLQSKVVLNRVLDVVQKIFSADAVMLMTQEGEERAISTAMARGVVQRDLLDLSFARAEDIPGSVFETKESRRVRDLSQQRSAFAGTAAAQGLESLLIVPLLARGRSIGVLAVLSRSGDAFSEGDLDLLGTFASQAALAIDTADMFSREHRVASVLQASIVPAKLPFIPGLDTSSIYRPARSDAEIGGDYYDVFVAGDGRVVLAIGDVCGKGVVAATKTSMIKYSLRGMVAAGLGPAESLAELNRLIAEAEDPTDIVTVWLGFLDVETGALTYANGGHPPGLLLQAESGEIVRLGTTGALLGAVASASYAERTLMMEREGILVLYTDGVTEARNRNRFFGEGRVRRELKRGGPAALVAQRLLASIERFTGGHLRDDAAVLTVRLLPRREA